MSQPPTGPSALDQRAEQAVAALEASTAGVRPAARLAGLTRRRARTVRLATATAFALMAGVLAVVLVLAQVRERAVAPAKEVSAGAVLQRFEGGRMGGRMPDNPVKVVELDGEVWMVRSDLTGRSDSLILVAPSEPQVLRRLDGGPNPLGAAVSDGAIWTLDFTGELRRIDPGSGVITSTGGVRAESGRFVSSLTAAGGSLWVATDDITLVRIRPADGRVTATLSAPGVTFGPNLAAGAGALWATSDSGASATRIGLDGRLTPLATRAGGGVAAGEGAVWLGGRDGTLVRLDPATGRVVATLHAGGDNGAIAAGAGGVWVGDAAARTLTRVDPGSGRATGILRLDSPPRALTVAAGSVWVTTEDAVLRVDPSRF